MRIAALFAIAMTLVAGVAVAGTVARDLDAGRRVSVVSRQADDPGRAAECSPAVAASAEGSESVMGPGYNPPPPWIPVS